MTSNHSKARLQKVWGAGKVIMRPASFTTAWKNQVRKQSTSGHDWKPSAVFAQIWTSCVWPLITKAWNRKDYLLSTSEMGRTLWLGGVLSLATLVLYLGVTPAWTKTLHSTPAMSLIIDWVQFREGVLAVHTDTDNLPAGSSTGIYNCFLFSFFRNVPFCRILYLSHRVFIKTCIYKHKYLYVKEIDLVVSKNDIVYAHAFSTSVRFYEVWWKIASHFEGCMVFFWLNPSWSLLCFVTMFSKNKVTITFFARKSMSKFVCI